ncbi:VanZ family protein [Tumebacillus flagellatus]
MYFYIVSVLCVVFFPLPIQQSYLEHLRSLPELPQNNFVPFRDIISVVTHDRLPDAMKQIGGNVLLFCPFGFLLPIAAPRLNFTTVLLRCIVFSILLELVQLILDTVLHYNYRTCDVDDVLLNTVGVAIGYLICTFLDKPLGNKLRNMQTIST